MHAPRQQESYRDYDPDHIYVPVSRLEAIRMLLVKVAAHDLYLEGLEIDNAVSTENLTSGS